MKNRHSQVIRARLMSLRTVELKRILRSRAMRSIRCMAYGILQQRGRL
jgi:hypothetical protein